MEQKSSVDYHFYFILRAVLNHRKSNGSPHNVNIEVGDYIVSTLSDDQESDMAKGKTETDIDMCKGCGLCLTACKSNVIKLSEQGQANKYGYRYLMVAHPEQCTGCGMCALMCPDSAITVWHSTAKS